MKSQELQELVKKIFGDEKTRLKFQSDPESVLKEFSLTDQERKAVLSTHARLGLVTGNSGQLSTVLDSADPWGAPAP